MTTVERVAEFDIFGTTAAERYEQCARWRAAGPIFRVGPGQWAVARHAEVERCLKDRRLVHGMPRRYLSFVMGEGPSGDFRFNSILNQDGPAHLRIRRLMSQAFTPALVRELVPRVEALVDELIEPLLDGEDCDIVDLLAYPLPSNVICDLLGLQADRDEVRKRAAALATTDVAASDESTVWFREYLSTELSSRAPDPDGDLLQRMLAAEDGDDAFDHDEIVDNAVLLFFAGFETTKHVITGGTAALIDFPDQQAKLLADPSLAASAVEEFLRFDGPVPFVSSMALEALEIGPVTAKPGAVIYQAILSANHDETVFADPGRLDIGRVPNPHLTFGGGPHRCLGMHLARMETETVFRRLADRLDGIEDAGPRRRVTVGVGTWDSVPVRARAS